jgi:predicted CXXCH cytochrome family protein
MRFLLPLLVILLLLPALAFAAGGHDGLTCTGCHGIHTAKGNIIFAVAPNKETINPRTKKPFPMDTALCLGCHETTGGMGIAPIYGKSSHPYGIKPKSKIAAVPSRLLRNGSFECVGCHDPHPSNTYPKYLRVNTGGSASMQDFCSLCHSSKSGQKIPDSRIFSSMDETKSSAKAARKAAPKKK